MADLVDQWGETAGPFEDAIASLGMWPAVLDALAHEHASAAPWDCRLAATPRR